MSTIRTPLALTKTARLAALFHYRWGVLVIAELHAGTTGGRFAVLARRLEVGRPILTKTLAALIDQGLARKNPGYGHPLRPEYMLTSRGVGIGAWCERLVRTINRLRIEDVILRKWSVPTLFSIHYGLQRFSELKESLPGITSRALILALRDLHQAGLIKRVVKDTYPPRVLYRILPRAQSLAKLLDEFQLRD